MEIGLFDFHPVFVQWLPGSLTHLYSLLHNDFMAGLRHTVDRNECTIQKPNLPAPLANSSPPHSLFIERTDVLP